MTPFQFFELAAAELAVARHKFPTPNPTLAALTEEVGELAKALLHISEGKSGDWNNVIGEAKQVAALAARIALEGDASLDVQPYWPVHNNAVVKS